MLDAVGNDPHCDTEAGPDGANPLDCGRHDTAWFVVRCQPDALRPKMHHGARVESGLLRPALHRLGFATFLPLERRDVPDRRLGKRTVTVPAFAGCLFVRWAPGADWARILSQPGVLSGGRGLIRPVGDPYGHPQAVPADLMDALLARATDGGVVFDFTAPKAQPRRDKRSWRAFGAMSAAERAAVLERAMRR